MLSLCVWFIFGRAVGEVLDAGVSFQVVAYAVLALTVVRILPVLLALRGTTITRSEALFIRWTGPRGLASLVFGLLALIALNRSESALAVQVMVITVLLSVILHGVTAGPLGARFERRAAATGSAEEPAATTPRGFAGQ